MRILKNSCTFIFKCVKLFFECRLTSYAAEMAYYLVFAFFPLLMIVHSSLSILIRNYNIKQTVFYAILPSPIEKLLDTYIEHISINSNITFMVLGVILAVISLSNVVNPLKRASDQIFRNAETNKRIFDTIISILFSVLILIAFLFSLVTLVLGGHILDIVGALINAPEIPFLSSLVRVLFTGMIIFVVVLLIYYYLFGKHRTMRYVIISSALATSGWIIVTSIFTFYMNNFSRYTVIYGSIGAFIILLLWIYVSCIILLSGIAICAILIKQKNIQKGI